MNPVAEDPSDAWLKRIMRRLIVRSFPRIRRVPVTITWGAEDELLLYTLEAEKPVIWVNTILRPAPRFALEGGIAHELCHIEADLGMGPYRREHAWDRYRRLRWHRIREERTVERRVIELGYGANLLAFIRFAHRLGHRFSREHGLLQWEIQRSLAVRTWRHAEADSPARWHL